MSDWTLERTGSSPYLITLSRDGERYILGDVIDCHASAEKLLQALREWKSQGMLQAPAQQPYGPGDEIFDRYAGERAQLIGVNRTMLEAQEKRREAEIAHGYIPQPEQEERAAGTAIGKQYAAYLEWKDSRKTVPLSSPLSESQPGYGHYPAPTCE
jgi:hypothetical protein